MSRYLLLIAAVMLIAIGAFAEEGDYTWGSADNSVTQSGQWESSMVFDGSDFIDLATDQPVVWPGLDIELWIEAECTASWEGYDVDIVRTANYSNFEIRFLGSSSCNLPIYVVTEAPGGAAELSELPFKSGVPGSGVGSADPIQLTWEYSIDGSSWAPMNATDKGLRFLVEACDHNLRIRCIGAVPYHQEPGYYRLGGEDGYHICPIELM